MLKDFRKSGKLEVILKMEKPQFFDEEFLDGDHIGTMLKENLEKLDSKSMGVKVKQTRFRILLSEFDEIRQRIQTILKRLEAAEGDEEIEITVDSLRDKDLITVEQWEKLKDDDNAYHPEKIVEILKIE